MEGFEEMIALFGFRLKRFHSDIVVGVGTSPAEA